MRSYTLYTHSTEADNFCTTKLQVVENASSITVIEKTIDTSTEELATANLQELFVYLKSQLPKGEKMIVEIVELNKDRCENTTLV
jgi:hypothetical protein